MKKTKNKTDFELFCEDIEKFTAAIEQKRSLKTMHRTGGLTKRISLRIRDVALVFKVSWTQAESWIALPKAAIFFLALTTPAIVGFNGAMEFAGIPFSIPLGYGSFLTIALVGIVAAFGIVAHRNLGLRKGQNALAVKQNAGWFMAWRMWNDLKKFTEEKGKNNNDSS